MWQNHSVHFTLELWMYGKLFSLPLLPDLHLQKLEKEIADFSKDHDKRVKAAQAKLKTAKQV